MVLTHKEIDALGIAGFSSVSELLARYFELLNQPDDGLENQAKFKRKVPNTSNRYVDAIGTDKAQITFGRNQDKSLSYDRLVELSLG